MTLEGYDLVMVGILAAAALLGYFKGMVWQLAWIAGIVASSYAAFRFGGQLAPVFGNQAPWNRFAAMLAVYVGTSLAVWIVFRLISGAINAVHLSAFDHQLGLLLGLAKGVLLCVIITFFSVILAPAYRQQIVASRSGRLVAELIVRADTYLPKEIHDTVDPFVKQFERQLNQPAGGPAAAMQPAPVFGQAGQPPSALKAIFDGVSSAAAWAGAEQGGQGGQGAVQAGGSLPPGSAWFVPRPATPVPAAAPPRYAPAGGSPAPSAFASPDRYSAPTPVPQQSFAPSRFTPQPAPPQPYPVGAQSPLPRR